MPAFTNPQPRIRFDAVTAGHLARQPVFRRYDVVVDGPGTVLLTGANGAGKSTFVELVSGYLLPAEGTVRVGEHPASSSQARRGRSVVRTRPALYQNMTAHDHLCLAAAQAGVPAGALFERAGAYGLAPWLHHAAQALSTGNAKKLWLLMCTPEPRSVVALDEPFDGLDDAGIQLLLSEIAEWSLAALVLVVAHQPPAELRWGSTIALSAAVPDEEYDHEEQSRIVG